MFNNTFTVILGLAILILGASVWERFDDRRGDLNKKQDIFFRGLILFLAANINTLLNASVCEDWRRLLLFLGLSLNLALASFILIFDYWVTYTLIKRGVIETPGAHWFSYLRAGGFDSWAPWRKLSPKARLFVRIGYFVLSIVIYFIWK